MDLSKKAKLPNKLIWGIIFLCILPTLLNLLGISFGSNLENLSTPNNIIGQDIQYVVENFRLTLAGNLLLSILEWSAFWIAMFTVILAFTNFRITGDVTTPIIGTVLFCAGAMDGIRALIIYRFIKGIGDSTNLAPLSWTVTQLFYGLLLLFTISLFSIKDKRQEEWEKEKGFGFAILVSTFFFIILYGTIHILITSKNLPVTIFPNSPICRPWEILPLALFLIIGIFILPNFYKRHESIFSHALLISIVPQVFSEFHMAFGSTSIFDNHFNIAHFLKVVSYLVTFAGLVMDYHRTYRESEDLNLQLVSEIFERKYAEKKLAKQALELKRSNEELEQFTYIASHDLKEPLRMVTSYTQLLKKRYKDKLDSDANEFIDFAVDGALRMQNLINDLLNFSRVTTQGKVFEYIELQDSLNNAMQNLKVAIDESNAKITYDPLPKIKADRLQISQLFQNLLGNAIKYKREDSPKIHISITENKHEWHISISDNGIGIDPLYKEKIFVIFQRLHTKNEYSGTGIGLAICKKIVQRHGGRIWVESEIDKGSTFHFTIKKDMTEEEV